MIDSKLIAPIVSKQFKVQNSYWVKVFRDMQIHWYNKNWYIQNGAKLQAI